MDQQSLQEVNLIQTRFAQAAVFGRSESIHQVG